MLVISYVILLSIHKGIVRSKELRIWMTFEHVWDLRVRPQYINLATSRISRVLKCLKIPPWKCIYVFSHMSTRLICQYCHVKPPELGICQLPEHFWHTIDWQRYMYINILGLYFSFIGSLISTYIRSSFTIL